MDKKERILQMYFEEHQKQNVIAESVGVKQSYVSQVIKKDERYWAEKENRHKESTSRKAEYNKEYYKTYERPKKEDNSYEQLKAMHEQASKELSYTSNTISDYAFLHWNLGAYHRDNNGNMRINKGLKVGFDIPKLINMNIKVPTQKYKHKCCFSN